MTHRKDLYIRDPFVLPDKGTYFLYGSCFADRQIYAYRSADLENFEGPFVIFDGHEGFWADRDYWAPEVHRYRGRFYLFASFKSAARCRGTQILAADNPLGPFRPISDGPATPENWECLDGTLWIENGIPYMVFCHEWIQIGDGEICAVPLSADLTRAVGQPKLLFRASACPGAVGSQVPDLNVPGYVTDGPFLFRENQKTKMLWSTFTETGYTTLESCADSLLGNWEVTRRVFSHDGGHAMLFKDFSGQTRISLHTPNDQCGAERAVFLPFESIESIG